MEWKEKGKSSDKHGIKMKQQIERGEEKHNLWRFEFLLKH